MPALFASKCVNDVHNGDPEQHMRVSFQLQSSTLVGTGNHCTYLQKHTYHKFGATTQKRSVCLSAVMLACRGIIWTWTTTRVSALLSCFGGYTSTAQSWAALSLCLPCPNTYHAKYAEHWRLSTSSTPQVVFVAIYMLLVIRS